MIYAQNGPSSGTNSGNLETMNGPDDRGSVKSDQLPQDQYNSQSLLAPNGSAVKSMLKTNRNLPLLPKVREEAIIGRTHSLPDNVLL